MARGPGFRSRAVPGRPPLGCVLADGCRALERTTGKTVAVHPQAGHAAGTPPRETQRLTASITGEHLDGIGAFKASNHHLCHESLNTKSGTIVERPFAGETCRCRRDGQR